MPSPSLTAAASAFLKSNLGLPFCHRCLAHELGATVAEAADATAVLLRADDYTWSAERYCARCFRLSPAVWAVPRSA